AAREPQDADDRQRRAGELPRDPRLPVGGRDCVRAHGDHQGARTRLLQASRHRRAHRMSSTAGRAGGRYAPRWLRRSGNWLLNGWAVLAYVYLFAPIFVIVLFSFNNLNGINHPFNYNWKG